MQDKTPKKIALVTGGATRIGKDISVHLLQNGWHVAITYCQSRNAAEELTTQFTNAIAIHTDLNLLTDSNQIYAEIEQKLGSVSLLINNAAIFENDLATDFSAIVLNKHMQINCLAPIILTTDLAKRNLNHNHNLNVINILDYLAVITTQQFFSYQLSKAALLNASKQLARQLAPNCRVNAISPGLIHSGTNCSSDQFAQLVANSPLATAPTSQQICATIDFIVNTSSMTGNNIILDGGKSL